MKFINIKPVLRKLFRFEKPLVECGRYEYRQPTATEKIALIESNLQSLVCVINSQENNALDASMLFDLTLEQSSRLDDIVSGLIEAKQPLNKLVKRVGAL